MSQKHRYTNEQIEWLKENSSKYRGKVLLQLFNEKFNATVSLQALQRKLCYLNIGGMKSIVPKDCEEWIKNNSYRLSINEVVDSIKQIFGLNFKHDTIRNFCESKGYKFIKRHYTEFNPEHEEWIKNNYNKYFCGDILDWEQMRKDFEAIFNLPTTDTTMKNLFYYRANLKTNHCTNNPHPLPLGSEVYKDGVCYVKIDNQYNIKKNYKKKVVLMYEKYHNTKVNKGEFVYQLDGNKNNYDKDNLFLIKTTDLKFKKKYEPTNDKNLNKLIILEAMLNARIAREEKENE